MSDGVDPRVSEPVAMVAPILPVAKPAIVSSPASWRRRLKRCWWHFLVRQITFHAKMAIAVAGWIGRKPRPIGAEGCEVMLTGRFDSANWILAHLGPLSASKGCSRLSMVSTNPVPDLSNVVGIYPPKWLIRIAGATPARLLTFVWHALRRRPHIVGGFHLIPNGIVAALAGRLAGARSMYFCVGGPAEVIDGGVHSEDNPFAKMERPDAVVEKRLVWIVSRCDTIVTMGTRAVTYFQDKGVRAAFHVVSGGIDSQRFHPSQEASTTDLILTGRLVPIKRMDVFLHAVKLIKANVPGVKATIVGDGKLREELRALSDELGIVENIDFAGHQDDVESWLRRAKVFVLTSDSEGLSLSMMEAMMSGLPAVVSDVGDLGDLVVHGVNGYLVPRRSPEGFARWLTELLQDERKLKVFSEAARRSALTYGTEAAIQRWDDIFAGGQNT